MDDDTQIFLGYNIEEDREFLITIWPGGEGEFATRPGQGQTNIGWSAPVPFKAVA